jgi:signal transduction histidine kinase
LTVDDNGRGLASTDPALHGAGAAATGTLAGSGHGLINIERRAFNLGGSHQFGKSELGGASVQIRVPLEPSA